MKLPPPIETAFIVLCLILGAVVLVWQAIVGDGEK